MLEHTPLTHILILSDRLYCPGPFVGHRYSPGPLPPCLDGGVTRAGVQRKWPVYSVDVVVGQIRQRVYTLAVLAQGPRRQIVVAACASGSSWLGIRGHIPQLLGL